MNLGGIIKSIATMVCLQLIGGRPLSIASIAKAEGLPIARSLLGGLPFGSLLTRILGGGLGAVFQNPVGAISGILQGQIPAAIGSIMAAFTTTTDVPGSGTDGSGGGTTSSIAPDAQALVGSLQSLTGTLGSLTGTTNLLSGLSRPDLGQFGLADILGHAAAIAPLGDTVPANLSLGAVLGPLKLGGALDTMSSGFAGFVDRVVAGTVPLADARATIDLFRAGIQGAIDTSSAALTTGQNVTQDAGSVAAAAVALRTGQPELQAVLSQILTPAALGDLQPAPSEGSA